MHDPGHSGRGSAVVVAGVEVCGLGFGRPDCEAALVLSQQTEPLLHVEVWGISTDGRSQNAAMMLSRQYPGHFGPNAAVGRTVVATVVVGAYTLEGFAD